MLYQDLDIFKKHLENSFPDNLRNIFFIIAKEDFDRKKTREYITCFLPKNMMSILKLSGAKDPLEKIIEPLETISFFKEKPIIIVDDMDRYLKKDIQKFVSYLRNNLIEGFLVLSAKNKKNLLTLFSEVTKKGMVLDLTYEKKYQKEKRIKNFLKEKCAQSKKIISEEAMVIFLEKIGFDMSSLEKEIEKAICYVGERSQIDKEDIIKISSTLKKNTVWELSEKIVWEDNLVDLEDEDVDNSFFYSLLASIRYQLREGYKLIYQEKFSKFSEVKRQKACFLGNNFFEEALKLLFSIEILSKSNVTLYMVLLDYFISKLHILKRYETYNFP